MAAKCEVFMNNNKNFHRHLHKTNMTAKQGMFKDHRGAGTHIAYKCKIFDIVM